MIGSLNTYHFTIVIWSEMPIGTLYRHLIALCITVLFCTVARVGCRFSLQLVMGPVLWWQESNAAWSPATKWRTAISQNVYSTTYLQMYLELYFTWEFTINSTALLQVNYRSTATADINVLTLTQFVFRRSWNLKKQQLTTLQAWCFVRAVGRSQSEKLNCAYKALATEEAWPRPDHPYNNLPSTFEIICTWIFSSGYQESCPKLTGYSELYMLLQTVRENLQFWAACYMVNIQQTSTQRIVWRRDAIHVRRSPQDWPVTWVSQRR